MIIFTVISEGIDENAAVEEAFNGPNYADDLARCYLDIHANIVGFTHNRNLDMEHGPKLTEILKHFEKVFHKEDSSIYEQVYEIKDTCINLDNHKKLINSLYHNLSNLNNVQKCYLHLLKKLNNYKALYSANAIEYDEYRIFLEPYTDRWFKMQGI